MKIIIALLLLLWGINPGYSQMISLKDTIQIHRNVFNELKEGDSKSIVFPSTKKDLLKGFNFKNGVGIDKSSNKPWNKADWKKFLSDVNTTLIKDYSLASHGEKWFKPSEDSELQSQRIVFAPIIFSTDCTKALSITSVYSAKNGSGSKIAWYFEKEKLIWKLKGLQTYSYED